MTLRRVKVLIAGLPADCALARSQNGADAEWSLTAHLLALLADQGAVANWQRVVINSKSKPAPPKPIPRPGVEVEPQRRGLTLEQAELLQSRAPGKGDE